MKKLVMCVIFVAAIVGVFSLMPKYLKQANNDPISRSGVPAPTATLFGGQETLNVDGKTVTIKKKYKYEISGIVRMAKKYKGGSFMDKVSPVDLCLVWGNAALFNDQVDYDWFYEGRNVVWTISCPEDSIVDPNAIGEEVSYANLIPQSEAVKEKINKIKINDFVKIKGYLVDAVFPSDVGGGLSSEEKGSLVIYVEDVEW